MPVDILGEKGPAGVGAGAGARRAARGGGSPRSVPAPLLGPAIIAVAFLVLPLAGLVVRAPWGRLGSVLSGSDAVQALVLSLWTATVSTGVCLLIGVRLAWVRARTTFPGRRLLRALVTLPLVLPPVVGGVALLLAFGRTGFIGRYLDSWFGLTIPFSPLAVVMAETFVAMPFLIITVEGALRSADQGFEEAAATLGATRMTVFRRVTVPLIAPSLGAGAVLCCARAPGEVGAAIAWAGLTPVAAGRIVLAGQVIDDAGTGAFADVATRPVGFVFQDYRLFPHLSVADNVAFSPRARGMGRRAARSAASGWLDRLGLT